MRIISGIAKGKKIIIPIDKNTRPLKDLVRESIFNIITHSGLLNRKITECIVLDLFSGVGSFGLEAISRGAKKVVFYENYNPAIELLNKNINNLSFNNQAEVNCSDIYSINNIKKIENKFDIIFLDPPFKDENIINVLQILCERKIFKTDSLVVLHRHKKSKDNLNKFLKIIREEIYGSSKIFFGQFNI